MDTALYVPIGYVAAAIVTASGTIIAARITAKAQNKEAATAAYGYHRQELYVPYGAPPARVARKSGPATVILGLITCIFIVIAIRGFLTVGTGPKPPIASPSAPAEVSPSATGEQQRPDGTASPTTPGGLESTTAAFLNEYYVASRNGGLGEASVLRNYFTDPFEWYGYKKRNDPKPNVIEADDRPRFLKNHVNSGYPDEAGCKILAIDVTDVRQVDTEVVVKASLPWGISIENPQGTIPVIYTLTPAASGKAYRIHKVRQVDPFQQEC